MCNDHEHYIGYSSNDYSYLCFRHSVLEALKGKDVEVCVDTYSMGKGCEVCNGEDSELDAVRDMLSAVFHQSEYLGDKKKLREKVARYINEGKYK